MTWTLTVSIRTKLTTIEQTSVNVDEIKSQETEAVELGISKRTTTVLYKMKSHALRTTRVLIAFDDDNNEKPPAKEIRKQVLQDALEQRLQYHSAVQGTPSDRFA